MIYTFVFPEKKKPYSDDFKRMRMYTPLWHNFNKAYIKTLI